MLTDMIAEAGFLDAEITHEIVPVRGNPLTVELTFEVKRGGRSRQAIPANPLAPSERCALSVDWRRAATCEAYRRTVQPETAQSEKDSASTRQAKRRRV
jgi:hypothetical protein